MKYFDIFKDMGITEYGVVKTQDANDLIIKEDLVFSQKTKYTSIDDILSGSKSIIVYLLPYNHGGKPENLSLYATGQDYHLVFNKISSKINQKLKEDGYDSVFFSDSGPLNERKLAERVGLGFIGDNHFLINKKYGSYAFIGYIITTLEIKPSIAKTDQCLHCDKCVFACPTNALSKNNFDFSKCISYITQKKEELTNEEIDLIKKGKSVWGCDICQRVCPMNKDVSLTHLPEFKENLILCIKNEYLSNRQYQKKYRSRAFSWRGKSVIDRNLSILTTKDDNEN